MQEAAKAAAPAVPALLLEEAAAADDTVAPAPAAAALARVLEHDPSSRLGASPPMSSRRRRIGRALAPHVPAIGALGVLLYGGLALSSALYGQRHALSLVLTFATGAAAWCLVTPLWLSMAEAPHVRRRLLTRPRVLYLLGAIWIYSYGPV